MRTETVSGQRFKAVVIPAAGRGTRLLPVTLGMRKELLPVGRKPLIVHAVEEASASGAEKVVIVVAAGDESLPRYFERVAAETPLAAPLVFVVQPAPSGLADAIRCARAEVGEGPFGVILSDALILARRPCIGQLFEHYRKRPGTWVATRAVEPRETGDYGILSVTPATGDCSQGVVRVRALVEKPSAERAPSPYGVFGRYLLEAEIFAAIDQIQPDGAGELQLTDALNVLCRERPVYGCFFEGRHFDAGNWSGYAQANVDCMLDDARIAPLLAKYLDTAPLRARLMRAAGRAGGGERTDGRCRTSKSAREMANRTLASW